MILELTPNTHPILHSKVKPCSANLDRHFVAKTLVENMHHYEGIGLAANQIGMDIRAFAMVRDLENNEVIVCFNPKIIIFSETKSILGSFSPDLVTYISLITMFSPLFCLYNYIV